MKRYSIYLLFFFFLPLFQRCTGDEVINSYYELPTGSWEKENVISFPFLVKDTSLSYKSIPKIIIHKNYYYSNLYLQYNINDSLGNKIYSEVKEHILFDPQTGKPMGSGISNAYSYYFTLIEKKKFQKTGTYYFTIQHFMAEDIIQEVQALGLSIKKI